MSPTVPEVDIDIDIDADDPDALIEAYAAHGWGDGLPLVAPTPGRVDTMLAALGDVDPDEVIAVLAPRLGEATRRMIAVHAVLAWADAAVERALVLFTGARR